MKDKILVTETAGIPLSAHPPLSLDRFLQESGLSPVTAWRYRRKGWLKTINICGRHYVTREAISDFNRKAWLQAQERRMEAQLNSLLALVERRDPALFKVFLSGKTGTNAIYDTVRALSASVKGENFSSEHDRLDNRK